VHEDQRAELGGGVEERVEVGVAEFPVTDAGPDLHAGES